MASTLRANVVLRTLGVALAVPVLFAPGCPTGGPGGDDDDAVNIFEEVAIGALVITEIQADPQPNRPEWIELTNTTDSTIDLAGCQVATRGASENEFVITGDASVAPGAFVLLGGAEFIGEEGDSALATEVVWSEISINQNDETELVELACPDGNGGRSLTDVVAFDPIEGWLPRKGHSWQLTGTPTAAANDDPAAWCEAPIQDNTTYVTIDGEPEYGTPGQATLCEELGGGAPEAEGDVIITEIAVDPCSDTKEWFEIHNPGAEAIDVRRCQIIDVPVDGSTDPDVHTIDAERGATVIPAGGFAVFKSSSTSDPDLQITPDGAVQGDYPYANGISFKNDDNQYLYLECPLKGGGTVEVDRVLYNWDDQGSGFKGRTLSLDPSAWTAEGNDSLDNWCLAPDAEYHVAAECTDVGSPGTANTGCPVPPPFPDAGEIVFTELMALSESIVGNNEEWIEIKSLGSETFGLDGCSIEVDDGNEIDSHVISFALGLTIDPGTYAVLVKSSAGDTLDCNLPHAYQYGTNLNFSNSAAETLRLVCPGDGGSVTIDEISYDYGTGDPRGIAWQLDPSFETAAGNDDPNNWCFPDPGSFTFPWECTVDNGTDSATNYGTPGVAGACPGAVGDDDDSAGDDDDSGS